MGYLMWLLQKFFEGFFEAVRNVFFLAFAVTVLALGVVGVILLFLVFIFFLAPLVIVVRCFDSDDKKNKRHKNNPCIDIEVEEQNIKNN